MRRLSILAVATAAAGALVLAPSAHATPGVYDCTTPGHGQGIPLAAGQCLFLS